MNSEVSFFENCSMEFHSLVSNISLKLKKTDKIYKKLDLENRKILIKYPKLSNILEEREVDKLSKKECDAMARYLDNVLYLKYKEMEEVYFLGYREAYFYFRKCDLLKEIPNKK